MEKIFGIILFYAFVTRSVDGQEYSYMFIVNMQFCFISIVFEHALLLVIIT
jgi:hypothetical protein